jgi:hypothetical protein
MSTSTPKVSPTLQKLIDKGLLDRLPVSFSTYTFGQIQEWDLLFPAEHSYYERLFGLLDRSDASEVDHLFAPMREIEQKMGINEKSWPKRQFTLDQVDFLNRNSFYPEWRDAVAKVFSHLDPLLDAEIARSGHARLAIVIAPAEIPVDPDRMWLRVRQQGKPVAVQVSEKTEDYLPLLLTGQPSTKQAPSIAGLYSANSKTAYNTWTVEGSTGLRACVGSDAGCVNLSYDQLGVYRKRLMAEVRRLVSAEEIRGPRQLSARLKQLKLLASEGDLARDAVLAEFARAVLLAGNGTLLVNNTFVEWATVQGIRRARPSLVISSFGIRNKIKPFTSLLIYTDQDDANPIPSQMDTLGTYVDLEIFYQYLWQEFEKYVEYRKNTAYLFVGEGMDQMFVIAPPDFPLKPANEPMPLAGVFQRCKEWLNV